MGWLCDKHLTERGEGACTQIYLWGSLNTLETTHFVPQTAIRLLNIKQQQLWFINDECYFISSFHLAHRGVS